MAYIVKLRFDDGSKKEDWLVGEEYKGPNAKQLLAEGLIEKIESPVFKPKSKAKKKAEPKKAK